MKNKSSLYFPSQYITPLILIGLAFIAMLPYMPSHFYVNRDSGIFLYGGQQIVVGKTLYIDFWDHKGPLLFYINALGLILGQRRGVWLVECIFLSTALILSYAFIGKILNSRLALWATIAWLYSFFVLISGGNFSEEYSLPLNFLSIILFDQYITQKRKISLILVGLSMGLNILIRPNNIGIQLVAIGIVLLEGLYRVEIYDFLKNVGSIILGVVIAFIPAFIFFYTKGALDDLAYVVFFFNFKYANNSSFSRFSSLPVFLLALGAPCWGAMIGWYFVLRDSLQRKLDLSAHIALLFLIGFPLELLLVTFPGRPYPHYALTLLPYFGLLNAVLLQQLIRLVKGPKNIFVRIGLPVVCILALTFSIWTSIEFMNKIDLVNVKVNESSEIVQYVKTRTLQDDYVLVWGQQASINFLTQRESPTPFVTQTMFYNGMPQELQNIFLSKLEKNKPALIIITDELPFSDHVDKGLDLLLESFPSSSRNMFKGFSEYVNRNYKYVDNIQGWKVYALQR